MSRTLTAFFGIFSFLMFTACASTHYYVPAKDDSNSYGYRDQKLEETKYRVSFNGGPSTPRETVELYLLYRAAEITLENGYEYFTMVSQDTDAEEQRPSSSFFTSVGFGGRGSAFGLGTRLGPDGDARTEAVAFITLLKTKPANDASTYNAKEIQKNLRPKIIRPEKK